MQNEVPIHGFIDVTLIPGSNIVLRRDRCVACNSEVLQWCQEVIKHTWSYDIHQTSFRARGEDRYQLIFLFRDPRDATLFKLSWG